MRWPLVTLGDHVKKIGSGITPRGGDSVYVSSGTALIRSQNVYNNTFQNGGLAYISEDQAECMRGVTVLPGDLLLNITGDSVARCCMVPNKYLPARVNQHVSIIRPKHEEIDSRFLMYFLTSPYMQARMLSLAGSGGTRKALTKGIIEKFSVPRPSITTQKSIVEILSQYDNLIENNQRRIALLEEAARQLYKEWFVRFRFPGHEHVPIIYGVPEGWKCRRLIDLAEITMGQSPKSKFYNEDGDGMPFHQGVTNFGFRYVSHRTFCTKPIRLSRAGDILFSVRAPVGRINMTEKPIVLGRGLSAMRSRTGHQSFLFYQLKSYFFREDMVGGGAIYAAVSKNQLENQELLSPPENLEDQFDELATGNDEQIRTLTQSNEQLSRARDILLPKLMSGEIAV